MIPIEDLGRAVFEDQRMAYNRGGLRQYECLYCEAPPGVGCDPSVGHHDNYRLRTLHIAAERHRAEIEALSELAERIMRGNNWLSARGHDNEH